MIKIVRLNLFFVSSDFDRNKFLYEIQMKDWYRVLDDVSSDSIISMSKEYKEKEDDYESIKKERLKENNIFM